MTQPQTLTPAPDPALTRRQKAAVIVRFLLNEGAEVAIDRLSDDMQADLAQMMGSMRYVDRATLSNVIVEFAQELESIGLSFPKGIKEALNSLEGKISQHTADRLRHEAGVIKLGDPWSRICDLDIETLIAILRAQSTEVAAVILAKLEVTKAAELLSNLPGPEARSITYAISLTDAVTPQTVTQIGIAIASQLDKVTPRAFSDEPVARVGAILNFSPASTRESLLIGLTEDDQPFADQVRKAIFTYPDIPERIQERDVPKIIREVDQDDLISALCFGTEGPEGATSSFLLSNMSSRMADQLREEVAERGSISEKDGEMAFTKVVIAVRALQAKGELSFIPPAEEEDATAHA
ncbi:FliG C-terminal domain-containing protein [Cognatishimia sp. WU-CL00825]|uniref:flagellar motor switch protein FliG n=1 Tax=Cognatishimia sp. WU-CL00825 TaxID=3127658 RepID=UPI0031051B60